MNENKKPLDELKEQIDKKIEEVKEKKVQVGNIDYLMKLIDIRKDITQIEMEENNMYRGYGEYGRDAYGRDQYGRGYRDSYGRGYQGNELIAEMAENYQRYMEGNEYGAYGSPEQSKVFQYMAKALRDFAMHIGKKASTQEEKEMLKRIAREVMENV